MNTSTSELQSPGFSIGKFLVSIAIVLVVAFGLSYLYGIISSVMPIIYLSIIAAVGFGMGLGYTSIFAGYITKQTHRTSEIIVTVFAGLVAWYFSWVSYIIYLYRDEFESIVQAYFVDFALVFEPGALFEIISEINTTGLWEMFGSVVNGGTLTCVWIIEGLIIICTPVIMVFNQHKRPFSAKHNKWYREFILNKDFGSVYGMSSLKEDLQANPMATLEGVGFGDASRYTQVSIYFLEEESTQYLSLFDIRVDGDDKKEKNEIIHMLEIPKDEASKIMEQWHAKKSLIPFL